MSSRHVVSTSRLTAGGATEGTPGVLFSQFAQCPAGEVALGGGGGSNTAQFALVSSTYFHQDGLDGWILSYVPLVTSASGFTVYANVICAVP